MIRLIDAQQTVVHVFPGRRRRHCERAVDLILQYVLAVFRGHLCVLEEFC